jgi:hypothetical protein
VNPGSIEHLARLPEGSSQHTGEQHSDVLHEVARTWIGNDCVFVLVKVASPRSVSRTRKPSIRYPSSLLLVLNESYY